MMPWQKMEALSSVAEKLERDAHDYESWVDAAVAWEIAGDLEKCEECYDHAREWERCGPVPDGERR